MKLKSSILSIILFIAFLTGCEVENQTTITIIVKNKAGVVQPDVLVYEFENPVYDNFGSNPVYANKQKLTDKDGRAVFVLDEFEYDAEKEENILYFTVFNEKTSSVYTTAGTVAINFKRGDVVSKDLILN